MPLTGGGRIIGCTDVRSEGGRAILGADARDNNGDRSFGASDPTACEGDGFRLGCLCAGEAPQLAGSLEIIKGGARPCVGEAERRANGGDIITGEAPLCGEPPGLSNEGEGSVEMMIRDGCRDRWFTGEASWWRNTGEASRYAIFSKMSERSFTNFASTFGMRPGSP